MKRAIPWSMTLGRLLFAPLLIWLVAHHRMGWPIASCIVVETLLDVLDGMVARRLGVATAGLRRADSIVDSLFYGAVLFCAAEHHLATLRQHWILLAALLGLEATRYVFDYVKFRREAAYHMYSAKAWGLVLGAAVIALLAYDHAGWLLTSALLLGIVSDSEGLAISVLLHESVEDVPHIFRAKQVRRAQEQRAARVLVTAAH